VLVPLVVVGRPRLPREPLVVGVLVVAAARLGHGAAGVVCIALLPLLPALAVPAELLGIRVVLRA
jgi:hypothetical protein